MNNIDFLIERFDTKPSKNALVYKDKLITYGELSTNISKKTEWLVSKGVKLGDTVVLLGDYSPDSVSILLALTELRTILVPLTPSVYESLTDNLSDVAPRWMIDATSNEITISEYLKPGPRPELYSELEKDSSPGLVLFTSGSSGKPKAVVHDFSKLLKKFRTERPAMITINFLLFDHWGGLNTLLHSLSNLCLLVFPNSRTPQSICELIQNHKIELLPATPSFLNLLMISGASSNFDLSSLKIISYGAEPMPETTLHSLSKLFPNIELRQTYGMIELGVLRAKTESSDSLWVKIGGEGYKIRVVDGMLQIKAESAMLGYINAPSPFTDDGYMITGDMVEQKGDWLRILGRESDIINVGGQKVYPSEVEAVILENKSVKDCIVYGEANPITGKIVCSDILLLEGENESKCRSDILQFCKVRLQPYMIPMKLNFVKEGLQSARLKRVRSKQTKQ